MAKEKKHYVDPGWPQHLNEGEHPVTEVISHMAGATSPYGDDTKFPVNSDELNYVHPYTPVNRPHKR